MSKKRRLNSNVDIELAGIYDDLAHEKEATRIKAAELLLSRYSPVSKPTDEELEEVLKRLLRGLCSGRKAARLGFSVTLTEFLDLHVISQPDEKPESPLHLQNVIRILGEQTEVVGKSPRPEGRDYYFGRVFGAEAIFKSKVLFSSRVDIAHWERLIQLLFEVVKRKAWLSEECGWVLYEALQSSRKQSSGTLYAQKIIDALHDNDFFKTPEGVALWIVAKENFEGIRFPKHVYHHRDPLNRKERKALAGILKETGPSGDDEEKAPAPQKGNWFPKLHVAWEVVFAAVAQKDPDRVTFAELWKEAVDDGLFARSSTDQRKYWGFQLFLRHIHRVPAEDIQDLLTKHLLRCLATQLAAKDRNLHALAERCQQALLARAKRDVVVIVPILKSLLQANGLALFDQSTKTKTVEKLLSYAAAPSSIEVVSLLKDILVSPRTNDEKEMTRMRQSAADHLLAIIRSQNLSETQTEVLQSSRAVVDAVLETLSACAYFEHTMRQQKRPPATFSSQSHNLVKSRIISCLTHLMDKDPVPSYHPYQLAISITNREILQQRESRKDLADSVSRTAKLLREMHEREIAAGDNSDMHQTFELLLSVTIILIYNGEEDAVEIAEELQQCYQNLASDGNIIAHGAAVHALVEMILGLVSKPSLLFRRMAQQVFPTFATSLDQPSLASLIRVLETQENAAGQSELFDQASEDGDVEMMDVDGSDVEEIDDESTASQGGDANEGGSGSEVSEANDGADEEAAAFEAKLAQALGTRRADEDMNATSDESLDEDMNDEQMEKLDGEIATIFKQRNLQPNRKKENKDARSAVILFKCRVVELLEIFAKKDPHNPAGLDLIQPLLALIKQTSSKEAKDKAGNLIREWLKAHKLTVSPANADSMVLETAKELLKEVHDLAAQEGSNTYRNACSQASLLLVKVMLANGGSIQEAWQQYAETGSRFVTDPGCRVKNQFFTDWLNWCVSARQAYEKAGQIQ